MRYRLLAVAMLFQLTVTPCGAQGINAFWNECGLGPSHRTFACNTDTGTNDIVASFDPPPGLTAVTGVIGVIDLCLGGVNLVPWWQFNAGSCRETGLSAVAVNVGGATNCADYWQGQAAASVIYQVGYSGWDSARILVSVAMNPLYAGPVEPGTEHHAFTVRIRNTGTVGPGACFGCQYPACIVLNEIMLIQPEGTPGGSPRMSNPLMNNYLTWQGGVPNCPFVVPVANRTWGQIKSLYR